MGYPDQPVVDAVYAEGNADTCNPFLEALPEQMSRDVLFEKISSLPKLDVELRCRSAGHRRGELPVLSSIFIPMGYMYYLYDTIFRSMGATYRNMNTIDCVRQMNALFPGASGQFPKQSYITHAECCSVLGVPGIGKTSAMRRCLSTVPQVIQHSQYRGRPFYQKQILYLFVECPADCSIKTLCLNIAGAIDAAIGSRYSEYLCNSSRVNASSMVLSVKQWCVNHHVGLIVIDEIQNVARTVRANHQTNQLIRWLVELMNDTCTSVCLIGTLEVEELFAQEEHLKRRTRGLRLIPMKMDATYRMFLDVLWQYQLTKTPVSLTDSMATLIYAYSGGIPSYIVKLFQEAQALAIIEGTECLTEKLIKKTARELSIAPAPEYNTGTSISDMGAGAVSEETVDMASPAHRGRKKARRDSYDLLVIAGECSSDKEMIKRLKELSLLEETPC